MIDLYLVDLATLLALVALLWGLAWVALFWLDTRDRNEARDPDTPRVRSLIHDGLSEAHGDVPSLPARWPGRKGYFPETHS